MHRKLSLTNDADKFLDRLDAKQFKQVVRRILALAHEPTPAELDSNERQALPPG